MSPKAPAELYRVISVKIGRKCFISIHSEQTFPEAFCFLQKSCILFLETILLIK